MFSAGAGVFFPEPEFFFAGAGAGGEKPGVCTALVLGCRVGCTKVPVVSLRRGVRPAD